MANKPNKQVRFRIVYSDNGKVVIHKGRKQEYRLYCTTISMYNLLKHELFREIKIEHVTTT